MSLTRRVPRGQLAVALAAVALLTGWAVLFVLSLANQRGGLDARALAFAGVVGAAALVFSAALFLHSAIVRSVATCAAGTAVTVAGIFGGATMGVPLVPVGTSLVIAAVVIADGTESRRRAFIACAVVAVQVIAGLVALALAGRRLDLEACLPRSHGALMPPGHLMIKFGLQRHHHMHQWHRGTKFGPEVGGCWFLHAAPA
jgi:hypothetical protein